MKARKNHIAALATIAITAALPLRCASAQVPEVLPETVVTEVGSRIIHIHYPTLNDAGEVVSVTDGSGYLLDNHHAITAAHVVRLAEKTQQPLIVQVGVLPRHVYLTTARVERVDYRRDLALLFVNTYKLSTDQATPEGIANLCNTAPSPGSHYAAGGISPVSGGGWDSIQARWAPTTFGEVLDYKTLPALPIPPTEPDWNWREGDPVMVLQYTAAPGDSGGGIFQTNGCFAGVTSAGVDIKDGGQLQGVTIAVPVLKGDPFLGDIGRTAK